MASRCVMYLQETVCIWPGYRAGQVCDVLAGNSVSYVRPGYRDDQVCDVLAGNCVSNIRPGYRAEGVCEVLAGNCVSYIRPGYRAMRVCDVLAGNCVCMTRLQGWASVWSPPPVRSWAPASCLTSSQSASWTPMGSPPVDAGRRLFITNQSIKYINLLIDKHFITKLGFNKNIFFS